MGHKCLKWESYRNMYGLKCPYGLIGSCIKFSGLDYVKLHGEDDDIVLVEIAIFMIPWRIEFHQYFKNRGMAPATIYNSYHTVNPGIPITVKQPLNRSFLD